MLQYNLLYDTNAYHRFMLKYHLKMLNAIGIETTPEVVLSKFHDIKIGVISFESIERIVQFGPASGFKFVGDQRDVNGQQLSFDLANDKDEKRECKTTLAVIAPMNNRCGSGVDRIRFEWTNMENKTDPCVFMGYDMVHDMMRFFAFKQHEYTHGKSSKTIDIYTRSCEFLPWTPSTKGFAGGRNEFKSLEEAFSYLNSNNNNICDEITADVIYEIDDRSEREIFVLATKHKPRKSNSIEELTSIFDIDDEPILEYLEP